MRVPLLDNDHVDYETEARWFAERESDDRGLALR
jgi:hypothetical protein